MFDRFFAQQLARPSGLFERYVMGLWLSIHTRAVNAWALEQLALGPGDRLLDIGFGSGDLLFEALSRDGRLQAAGFTRVEVRSRSFPGYGLAHGVLAMKGRVEIT